MVKVTDEEFARLVADAISAIPEKYAAKMQNVGFVIEDEPSPRQRAKLHLHHGQTLYGLYEGIPLTERGGNYSGVLPDKITIFRRPMMESANSRDALTAIVRDTIWHEVAHHFGLDHDRIDHLQSKTAAPPQ